MARIIPDYVTDFHGSKGEEKVYEALKKLSDEYTIFYSMSWNKKEYKQVKWGESDFAILHPKKGLLFIEVKAGGMEYKDGYWYQTNLNTGEVIKLQKDPIIQASKSKYYFVDLLSETGIKCYTDVAVWFTSINRNKITGSLPHNYKKEIILDELSLTNVEKAINDVYNFYSSSPVTEVDKETEKQIINILAPYYAAIPSINASKEEREYAFLKMTNEQKNLLDFLEEQKTCAIQGSAGTGKTIIAMEKCRRLAQEDKVLFLCYNAMLEDYLRSKNTDSNIEIYNINALACKYLRKTDVSDVEIIQFLNYYDQYGFSYKNIVIDEGQDFDSYIIELFANISKIEDGNFYVFYDKNQLVRKLEDSSWFNNAECKITLSYNCRNTKEIALTSHSAVGVSPRNLEKLIPGDKANVHFVKDVNELEMKLSRLIDSYIKKGFDQNEIVILTSKTIEKSELKVMKVGKYNITHDFNVKNEILFTTVRKFKGLEAEAILFVDLNDDCISDELTKRLFYVGASRAKQYLSLVFNLENINIAKILDQIEVSKRKTDLMNIATHFNGKVTSE